MQQGIRYLIGIDGGGSGTRACLASPDGARLGYGEAGSSGLGRGIQESWRQVQFAIDRAFTAAGLARAAQDECAAGMGIAGAHSREHADEFLRVAPPFARLRLDTDSFIALLGAFGGRPGAIVVSGTGSVGEALHPDGRRQVAGGWGYPVGDEGSGAWLGLHAMRATQRALDGRGPSGPLARAVLAATGATRDVLQDWCENAGQRAYAQLAPLVFDAAATDPAAEALLVRAALALEEVATALDADGALPLAVYGSVGQRLLPRFGARVGARCVTPAADALDGALRLVSNGSFAVARGAER